MMIPSVETQCQEAGMPATDVERVKEAVAGFDSDDIRQLAVDELIAAWHRSLPPGYLRGYR